MPFKPGQSGNPKGRPPKSRALTQILEKAGSKTVEVNGKRISGKRLLAQMMWQAVTLGEVELPGGEKLTLGVNDWLVAAKWIYAHIDGPPKGEIDVTSLGEQINLIQVVGADPDKL